MNKLISFLYLNTPLCLHKYIYKLRKFTRTITKNK